MNEIKVGDIVRVSEHIPKVYLRGWDTLFKCHDCKVLCVEDGNAVIAHEWNEKAIPTKYLIKVNAEPKEQTIKIGDVVENLESHDKGVISNIGGNFVVVDIIGSDNRECWSFDAIKPVQPNEPTKKPDVGTIKIPVEADLTDSYWQAYTAELAKEIAVKITNKKMEGDPEEVGSYAVAVAEAVVNNLKKDSDERD